MEIWDLHRLRLLRELRDRGTLAAVAEALAYSPSAISQQLAVLAKEAGQSLVEPAGRGVRLTVAGEVLAEHAVVSSPTCGIAPMMLRCNSGSSGRSARSLCSLNSNSRWTTRRSRCATSPRARFGVSSSPSSAPAAAHRRCGQRSTPSATRQTASESRRGTDQSPSVSRARLTIWSSGANTTLVSLPS